MDGRLDGQAEPLESPGASRSPRLNYLQIDRYEGSRADYWSGRGGMTHLLGAWSSATGWGWVRIGRVYAMDSIAGTLDAHLKQCLAGATAGWVAVMLETAGVVHLDRTPPAKVTPNR